MGFSGVKVTSLSGEGEFSWVSSVSSRGLVKLFAACRSIDNPFQKCLPATQIDNPASLNYSLWVGNGIKQLIVVTKEKSH